MPSSAWCKCSQPRGCASATLAHPRMATFVARLKTQRETNPTHGAVPAEVYLAALRRAARARAFGVSGRIRTKAEAEATGEVSAARGADPPELVIYPRCPFFDRHELRSRPIFIGGDSGLPIYRASKPISPLAGMQR